MGSLRVEAIVIVEDEVERMAGVEARELSENIFFGVLDDVDKVVDLIVMDPRPAVIVGQVTIVVIFNY